MSQQNIMDIEQNCSAYKGIIYPMIELNIKVDLDTKFINKNLLFFLISLCLFPYTLNAVINFYLLWTRIRAGH